jgi:serine/threonine-protein kinase
VAVAEPTGSAGNRFGEIAVREGFATRAQVKECLEIQAKLRSYGVEPKKLGEIMVEKKYLKSQDTIAILEVQRLGGSRMETRSGASKAEPGAKPAAGEDGAGEPLPPLREIPGYEILGLLGQGGMGAVYKARQKSLDRIVALKILPPRAAKDETFIKRFISEARTVAKLNHENIIAGIDVGEADGTYYFAMEHVEGESLARIIEREGPLDEKRALEIATQVARALEHAHKHGLVHRDVKPQNILIAKNDVAKLCDLGLAKQTGPNKSPSQSDGGEGAGIPLGTPHYLSPEQARGEADVDIRSDIYSLGATLYHALTGEPPFDGQSPMVLMTKHLTEDPVPPRRRNPEVSKAASELVLRMMEKDKEDRPQSPTEVLEEIERVASGKKTSGKGNTARRDRKSTGRRKKSPGTSSDDDRPAAPRRAVTALRDGGPPRDTTPLVIAGVVALVVILVVVVVMSGGDPFGPSHASAPEETAAEKQFELVDGQYNSAKFNESLAENTAILRRAFQDVIDHYPNTEAAAKARKRLEELH